MPQPTTAEPIHETSNLALYQTKSGLEIHLQGSTHAVLVGSPKSVDAGKRFMTNAERHIGRLRRFLNHPE
jgi:hypothetical protein